jgi:hypothetical protein
LYFCGSNPSNFNNVNLTVGLPCVLNVCP